MSLFIHHPDGYVVFGQAVIPKAVWAILEPSYSLPPGAVGRIFSPGEKHHLIMAGNAKTIPADLSDPTLTAYLNRQAEYIAARDAYAQGAYIANQEGSIIVQAIDSLSSNKSELQNDGTDTATITCRVDDAAYEGAITWRVTAPDGTYSTQSATLSQGQAILSLTTTQEGAHTIRAEVARYGHKQITITAI